MNKSYYVMISPGLCGDWGKLVLIEKLYAEFLQKFFDYGFETSEEMLEEYSMEDLNLIMLEFLTKEEMDSHNSIETKLEFLIFKLDNHYSSDLLDNYYELSRFKSTLEFNNITKMIDYIKKNNIDVIGDIS